MIKSSIAAFAILVFTTLGALAQSTIALSPIATFDKPWAVAALPQGGFLVTEKTGALKMVSAGGDVREVAGVPSVDARGQVGLHDVALAPDFVRSGLIYLTWVAGNGGGDLHLGRGKLDQDTAQLVDFQTLWRAGPAGGDGHPGAMIAFSPDGYLFLTSGDRQLGDPAQDITDHRGKILRLDLDGKPAAGNPYPDAPDVWSMGHRNPYGLVFDDRGALWSHEMGPRGGDEFNRIAAGQNYGWPQVSEGRRYSGLNIPDHNTRPEFAAPLVAWVPTIAPSGMIYYTGDVFPQWTGSFLIGGLASQALVQVKVSGDTAQEVSRLNLPNRIRDVVADARGEIYVLEDSGRLLQMVLQ